MTEFKIGQRVREKQLGREGRVAESNYAQYIAVWLDGWEHKTYWHPHDVEVVEPSPTSPAKPDAKPECYVVAWYDGVDVTLTGDGAFLDKAAAEEHADYLARENGPSTVAVFKMVSKHTSAVTVTWEDV